MFRQINRFVNIPCVRYAVFSAFQRGWGFCRIDPWTWRNPPCPGGEIGRRKGLKIPRPRGHAGSIPALGTIAFPFPVVIVSWSGAATPGTRIFLFHRELENPRMVSDLRDLFVSTDQVGQDAPHHRIRFIPFPGRVPGSRVFPEWSQCACRTIAVRSATGQPLPACWSGGVPVHPCSLSRARAFSSLALLATWRISL